MHLNKQISVVAIFLLTAVLVPVVVDPQPTSAGSLVRAVFQSPVGTTPAATSTSTATHTPTIGPNTATPTSVPNTATATPVPNTATPTKTPNSPTATPTKVPGSPTGMPTTTSTPTPSGEGLVLALEAPAELAPGTTAQGRIVASGIISPGMYAIQFKLEYDSTVFTLDNIEINPDFELNLLPGPGNVSDTTGELHVVASRQGRVPGLIGSQTIATFDLVAANAPGTASCRFKATKIASIDATLLNLARTQCPEVVVGDPDGAPEPTVTVEPTSTPTAEPTSTPTLEPTSTPTATPTSEPTGTPEPTVTPTTEPSPTPTPLPEESTVTGQVILAGRFNNNWSGAEVVIGELGATTVVSTTTDAEGNFAFEAMMPGQVSAIAADAGGYLSAVCIEPTVTAPETVLEKVTLVSGDVDDSDEVDIADATAIGAAFGRSGANLQADINLDNEVDVLDLVLVALNFGATGPTEWVCQPAPLAATN